jgi:glucose/arabinose dehydrogenase
VRDVVTGLDQPTGFAFLGPNDVLITEKATGRVRRFTNGVANGVPLDLPVNSNSERGLLAIELHQNFARNGLVYLYWTQSTSGADSSTASDVPDLGNRVDRFRWNGSALTFDLPIIQLRARQTDANQPERGNHDGGKIKFGPDGKLYVMIGDVGRRGQMQNLPDGPFGNGLPDDSLGGPEPDAAHLTGVILRLNDDGTTPRDNPFFQAGREWGGPAGAGLQKVFAYGLRNGFGMAFDPYSNHLWEAQNSDDAFSELNRVTKGANLGWVQAMGPLDRVAQFRAIETDPTAPQPFAGNGYFGLQQVRWSPTNIATTPDEALARMFQVIENAQHFSADLTGAEEVPAVSTTAAAQIDLQLTGQGTLRFKLTATADITDATQAHLHLGARGQNGVVVAFLLPFDAAGRDFSRGQTIAEGELTDANLIARPGFQNPTIAELVARMKQGRVYANLHTVAHPPGEVRGQVQAHGHQVSQYSDPEFSWKFEVAPVGLGFLKGLALGREYDGDMFVGEARTFLENGYLFKFDMSRNRNDVLTSDPRLADQVADNNFKFDITESESLLFGRDFGITAEILTGPGRDGNLFVLSLSDGILREIHRPAAGAAPIFAQSLLPGDATPPTPAPPARATPRKVAVVVEADDLDRRPHETDVAEVRTGVIDGGSRAVDDLLALDPVVVG